MPSNNAAYSRTKLFAVVLGLSLIVAVFVLATRFKVSADLGVFMPPGSSVIQRVLLSQLDKGATSNLVFAGISGASNSAELAELNHKLSASLQAEPEFVQILNGSSEVSAAEQDFVLNNRYLLTPASLPDKFSSAGLKRELELRLRDLASPLAPLVKQFLAKDPTGEVFALLKKWRNDFGDNKGPTKIDGVWFSKDLQQTLLMVELRSTGLDMGSYSAAVSKIYRLFDNIKPAGATLLLSGPSVFATETRDIINSDLKLLGILASVAVIVVLFAAFRVISVVFLVMLPLICGIVAASAIVLLAFGEIHGITLTFGVTLIGVAVDYPIHSICHLGDPGTATIRNHADSSIAKIWPTLRLGALSTAVAYVVFMLSGFNGLQQLGVFTIAGLLVAAMATRWLLPFALPRGLVVQNGLQTLHNFLKRGGQALAGLGVWALGLTLIALAVIAFGSTPLRNLDFDSLSPIGTERRADDQHLRAQLQMWYGGKLVAVVAKDAEQALRGSEALQPRLDALKQSGVISRYDMAANFLPSAATQRARQAAIPSMDILRARLNEALQDSPFKKGVFEPFLQDAQQQQHIAPLTVQSLAGSHLGQRLSALLFNYEGAWIAPILLHDVSDEAAMRALNHKTTDYEMVYLHLKSESSKIMAAAVDRITLLLAFGVLLVYALLAIGLKRFTKPLYILLPTFSAVIVTVAILNASGVSLTLFHLVSTLLIIGLGIDYSLFFQRLNDDQAEWQSTFKALWVSCFTTILVFGILVVSRTPPLQAIGLTVGIGASLCLLFGACWIKPSHAAVADTP